jgi:anti-sigma B factor antagonist
MDLQVLLTEENQILRFKLVGEVDAFTAPILKERFEATVQPNGQQVELDLSEVAYMDSTGLGVFVGFFKTLKANEGHLKIVGVNSRLQRLFEITGLNEVMDIESTAESGDENATV